MSQHALANAAGVHRNVIVKLEAGRGCVASMTAAATALGLVISGRSLARGKNLGSRLLALRKRRGLSRREIAEVGDVSIFAVESLERSSEGNVTTLEAVARAIAAGLCLAPLDGLGFWEGAGNSSIDGDWCTPRWILDLVVGAVGKFDLDPCSPGKGKSAVEARIHLTAQDDGLAHDWLGRAVWLNPPYGKGIGNWLAKARHEVAVGHARCVVALIPARSDTDWFHRHCSGHADILLLKGRLHFGDGPTPAPFPSALVGYGLTSSEQSALFRAFPDAMRVAAPNDRATLA